jgi:hypothetical protein
MQDMLAKLAKLRDEAADCTVIAGVATERKKQELFLKLSAHLTQLADEVEKAIKTIPP